MPEFGKWIPVEESKPYICPDVHHSAPVLVCNDRGNIQIGYWWITPYIHVWMDQHKLFINNVVAWMPLPEPYETK